MSSPFTLKPPSQMLPEVDRNNPLTRRLICLPALTQLGGTYSLHDACRGGGMNKWPAAGDLVNLPVAIATLWPRGVLGTNGRCCTFTNTTNTDARFDLTGLTSSTGVTDFTFAFYVNRTNNGYLFDASAGRFIIGFGLNATIDNTLNCLISGFNANTWFSFGEVTGIWPINEWHFGCITCNDRTGIVSGYFDGAPLTLTGSGFSAVQLDGTIALGARYDGTGGAIFSGAVAFFGIWSRVLAPAEVLTLSRNPWQVFQSIVTKTYLIGAAAAAYDPATFPRSIYPDTITRRLEVVSY